MIQAPQELNLEPGAEVVVGLEVGEQVGHRRVPPGELPISRARSSEVAPR